MGVLIGSLIEASIRVLEKYPLCNHCLGRIFAKYGLDLTNEERGRALKILIQMILHEKISKNEVSKEYLKTLSENAGEPLSSLYRRIYGENTVTKPCYICGNALSRRIFEEYADAVYAKLSENNVKRFLIGVTLPKDVSLREIEVYSTAGFDKSETIRSEIKREVGKIVRDKYGLTPDFNDPEAVAIINFPSGSVDVQVKSIYLQGFYLKKARNISHVPWIDRGSLLYPISLQSFLRERLKNIFGSEEIYLHASGREDVDVRMLGNGRPVVVEVCRPKFRETDLNEVNKVLINDLIEFKLEKLVKRERIVFLKITSRLKKKIYKVLVYSPKELSNNDLEVLEKHFLTNNVVNQRTPTRVLSRKKDYLRVRRVHYVKTKMISTNVFEALIMCDGGLYVKELIHGDRGRTNPSFSSILSVDLIPIEVDVIFVEH